MLIVERALYALGLTLYALRLHRVVMWLTRRIPKVVLYHAVEPQESDATRDIDANVPPACFVQHLEFYARHYTVVPMTRLADGDPPEHALAITFDDGYRSVLTHAVPELAARRLPATVYIVPAVTGNGQMIWVNELNWLARRHPTETRRAFSEVFDDARTAPGAREMIDHVRAHYSAPRVRQFLAAIHRALDTTGAELARSQRLYLDWDEIDALGKAGLTVGNHTWSHPSVPCLPVPEQIEEITRGAAALRHLQHWIPSFAFPFGDHSDAAREAAVRAGHETTCDVGGLNLPLRQDRIARVPVRPHAGPAGLFAELEVVATAKGLVKSLVGRRRRAAPLPQPSPAG